MPRILAETNDAGTITAFYLYAGNTLLERILPSGTPAWYHADYQGSVALMTDSGGSTAALYQYDPFGNLASSTGPLSLSNRFRYLGCLGVYDNGDGTLDARARTYHPHLGRFLSKDALYGSNQDGQSLNRYVYGLNDPYGFSDASGFSPNSIPTDAYSLSSLNFGLEITSLGVGFVPVAGNIQSFVELITGQDYITGEEASRFWAAIGLVVTKGGAKVSSKVLPELVDALKHPETIEKLLLNAPKFFADHHIFPQKFRAWFSEKGLDAIDDFTVTVDRLTHQKAIHGLGNMGQAPGNWNGLWEEFISKNPAATLQEIYHFGGDLLKQFGLDHLNIHTYGN